MKKTILLTVAVLVLAGANVAQAQAQDDGLGVTLDNEVATQYIWRGYNLFGSKGAWMPSVDFDLYGSGFSANVWMAQPIGSGNEEAKELDYTIAYSNTAFEGGATEMQYSVNWIYYDFYEANRHADNQEVGAGASFPNVLDCGVVPSYYVGHTWYNKGTAGSGAFHILGLDYALDNPEGTMGLGTVNLHSDITYNGGYADGDHEWSHVTLGVSSDLEIGGVAFTPYVSYQISMDDSVNDDDELWGGISTSISF